MSVSDVEKSQSKRGFTNMAHTKADVISKRNEALRAIGEFRDVLSGVIGAIDNCKRAILVVSDESLMTTETVSEATVADIAKRMKA